MFSNLTNFSYKRTTQQAVGFYIAYLVLAILLGGVLAQFAGILLNRADDFMFGVRVGTITVIVYAPVVTYLVVKAKGITGEFSSLLSILLAAILSAVFGGLIGLLPAAYLTRK